MSTLEFTACAVRAASGLVLALAAWGSAQAATLVEGFSDVPALVSSGGWTVKNNSSPIGVINWFQGNAAAFAGQDGGSNTYAGVNYNSATSVGTISDWLISPTLTFNNGDVVSFYTRAIDPTNGYADRLELRFSSVGGTNVGTTATSTGDFSTLLVSVNPGLLDPGYPLVWTRYTATVTGLSGPSSGAIAFRYFVTNGGPLGTSSNYIGVDTLTITAAATAVPEPATWTLMAAGFVGAAAWRRRNALRGNSRPVGPN